MVAGEVEVARRQAVDRMSRNRTIAMSLSTMLQSTVRGTTKWMVSYSVTSEPPLVLSTDADVLRLCATVRSERFAQ